MAKRSPIRPIYSKKPVKNVYDYWDAKALSKTKCAGFVIDLSDAATGTRTKRHIRADYHAAKKFYEELRAVQREGNLSLPSLLKRKNLSNLGELLKRYEKAKSEPSLRKRQIRSPLTVKRTQVAVRGFMRALGRDPVLESITTEVIERFIRKQVEAGRKKNGINADLRTLKALFNWAHRKEIISRNPFAGIEMFPEERTEPRPLSTAELERLFAVCPYGTRWYPLIMTYLLTGARVSEILKPKFSWRNVDFENEIITMQERKGGKSSEIPMDDVLREIFIYLSNHPYKKRNQYVADDDHLYPFPFLPDYISHKIKAIMAEAGIDASAHDLRDSFVSHLIYLGYPLEDVSKIAGHSSIRVTEKHYYGQLEDRRRQMVSDLSNHFKGQTGAGKTGTENADNRRFNLTNRDQSRVVEDDGIIHALLTEIEEWALQESNLQPTDYESAALPLS